MGLLLRTDASDPNLDLGGSVVTTDDYHLTDTDARRSRQTSGLTTVLDHEQLRDEAKQSKALDDDHHHHDHDKLPTTYQLSHPLAGPIVPCYTPSSFMVDYNLPPAMGPPDAEHDLGSFSDEEEDLYCKVYEFSNGFVEDNEYVEMLNHEHLPDEAKQSKALDDDDDDELPTTCQLLRRTMLEGLAELAVVRYNDDNETSYQVVKIIRVNFRYDGWMFYNMTFQAKDDEAGSPDPRNFQARIRRFANETRVDFCRFEQEPKLIQDPDPWAAERSSSGACRS
ncbi:hypothetical protein RHMOL_Rhmol10G0257700 [Rhododendron molle]|uniref:Uncharacterized protein n=1 Tax=Rhododendron molle TaxID=49168 RepID=A0ACC0M7B3_RHOML|nr:hypothetical protein RHMOL_Rhmol10G0257700 [Rhododendron molle]